MQREQEACMSTYLVIAWNPSSRCSVEEAIVLSTATLRHPDNPGSRWCNLLNFWRSEQN